MNMIHQQEHVYIHHSTYEQRMHLTKRKMVVIISVQDNKRLSCVSNCSNIHDEKLYSIVQSHTTSYNIISTITYKLQQRTVYKKGFLCVCSFQPLPETDKKQYRTKLETRNIRMVYMAQVNQVLNLQQSKPMTSSGSSV